MQTTPGTPSSVISSASHPASAPVSSPTRVSGRLSAPSHVAIASGSLETLASLMIFPSSSTTHTDVSASETSRPA